MYKLYLKIFYSSFCYIFPKWLQHFSSIFKSGWRSGENVISSHVTCFLTVPKCHILHREKKQCLENSLWKPRVIRKKSTPTSRVARAFIKNAGNLSLISYFSRLPPPGVCRYISYSFLSPALELLWPVLISSAPKTFQQRSDSSLGHLHCVLATATYNSRFSLLWKTLNYWHRGEQLHHTLGIWVPVPNAELHPH